MVIKTNDHTFSKKVYLLIPLSPQDTLRQYIILTATFTIIKKISVSQTVVKKVNLANSVLKIVIQVLL